MPSTPRRITFAPSIASTVALLVVLSSVHSLERADDIAGYEEVDRNFIVIGATGAGKTTMINSLVHRNTEAMGTDFRASPSSMTKGVKQYTTPRYKMTVPTEKCQKNNGICPNIPTNEFGIKITFFDTIGVDAEDIRGEEVFKSLVKAVASHHVHGFLLVHKMDRFRNSYHMELKGYLRMLKELGINTNKILLAITHGGQYSDQVKEKYTRDICDLMKWFPECLKNTIHANFVNTNEIHPEFREFYARTWPSEFQKVLLKMLEYDQPFFPLANVVEKAGGFDQVLRRIDDKSSWSKYVWDMAWATQETKEKPI